MNTNLLAKRLSRINSAICCSTCLPGVSCGCALPANTNCTGRLGSFTMEASISMSVEDQIGALVGGEAARESDGQRVRAQHFARELCKVLDDSPRRSACSTARMRANSSSRDFRLRCVSQSSPSSTFSIPSQICGSPLCSASRCPGGGRRGGTSAARATWGHERHW